MTEGEKPTFFLDFVTEMKLLYFWQNFAQKFAHQIVTIRFYKERKVTSCHTMSQNIKSF